MEANYDHVFVLKEGRKDERKEGREKKGMKGEEKKKKKKKKKRRRRRRRKNIHCMRILTRSIPECA
jgi:hypothetical protein